MSLIVSVAMSTTTTTTETISTAGMSPPFKNQSFLSSLEILSVSSHFGLEFFYFLVPPQQLEKDS